MADMDCGACRVPIYRFVRTLNRKKIYSGIVRRRSYIDKKMEIRVE